MAKVETKLDEHCKAQEISDKENKEAHLRIETKIDDLPDRMVHQFSAKWVEKFIYGLIFAAASYFLYEVIKLLEK